MEMLEQVVKVVSPMTIVPASLTHFREAGLARTAMGFLTYATKLTADEWHRSIFLFANVVSLVVAVVIARDEETNKELANGMNISALVTLASTCRRAGEWAAGDDWGQAEMRARIAQYLWTTTAVLSEYANARLGPNAIAKIYQGFRFFNRAINLPKPACYDAMTAEQRNFAFGHELVILSQAAKMLKPYYSTQPPRLNPEILDVKGAVLPYAAFIETCGTPGWVDKSAWDPATHAGLRQVLEDAFSAASSVVIVPIALNDTLPDWLRPRMTAWLQSPVAQLRDVGVGALANSIRSEQSAIALLEPPSDLAAAMAGILSIDPPPEPNTQNAVLGLLRNLSIAEVNRERLGAPVLDAILGLRIWKVVSPAREPAQRNAMVTSRNLIEVPELAARFLSHGDSLQDLAVLVRDSKTASLRGLGLATFADAIANLGSVEQYPTAWAYVSTEGILIHPLLCLMRGAQDAPILSMGIKALRNVGENGTETIKRTLTALMAMEWDIENGKITPLEILTRVIAPPASGAPASNADVEADALAYVRGVKDATTDTAVRLAVAKNKAEGRRVAAGADDI